MADDYGHEDLKVGVGYALEGVSLWCVHPVTKAPVKLLTVEPEFARRIAEQLTLRSFECEDARGKNTGG